MAKLAFAALAATAALYGTALPGVAGAKNFKVNRVTDPTPGACTRANCTLREAVIAANARPGADKIVLRGGKLYQLAVPGASENAAASGDLDITDAVAIRPAKPPGGRTPRRPKIDANDLDRVFDVSAPAKLARLVIRDGTTPLPESGGGIQVNGGTLSVSDSLVTQNVAGEEGGGIVLAETTPAGTLKVIRSRVSANEANGNGGGGITDNTGTLRVLRSTVSGNHSDNVAGGIANNDGEATILRSTISGNVADNTSGGIRNSGSADTHLAIVNSTIEGNRAASEGGGMRISSGNVDLNGVTVVRNLANSDNSGAEVGGGIQEDAAEPVTIRNSVIALNQVGTGGSDPNCSVDITSGGHNLRGTADPGCTGFTGPGDLISASPKIGALKRNGGPTRTACPTAGSPAINAGGSDAVGPDQRGVKKVGKRDIGACEFTRKHRKKHHNKRH